MTETRKSKKNLTGESKTSKKSKKKPTGKKSKSKKMILKSQSIRVKVMN